MYPIVCNKDIWCSFADIRGSFADVLGSFADAWGSFANMYQQLNEQIGIGGLAGKCCQIRHELGHAQLHGAIVLQRCVCAFSLVLQCVAVCCSVLQCVAVLRVCFLVSVESIHM